MTTVSKLKPQEAKGEVSKTEKTTALTPFEEMERLFDEFLPRAWMRPFGQWPRFGEMGVFEGKTPRVDVVDRESEVLVRAEVPGVEKDKLDVSISEHMLTISGSTSHEEEKEEGNYYRKETSRGEFYRSVRLPGNVDTEHVKASYKDGLLEVTLPKLEKEQRRKVAVE